MSAAFQLYPAVCETCERSVRPHSGSDFSQPYISEALKLLCIIILYNISNLQQVPTSVQTFSHTEQLLMRRSAIFGTDNLML